MASPVTAPLVAGGPGRGLGDEYGRIRRGHAEPGVVLLPSHAELTPVFEVGVAAAHLGELVARPLIGLFHVGRAGEARADAVGQAAAVFHDVGVLEAFGADAVVDGEVDVFNGGLFGLPGSGPGPGFFL